MPETFYSILNYIGAALDRFGSALWDFVEEAFIMIVLVTILQAIWAILHLIWHEISSFAFTGSQKFPSQEKEGFDSLGRALRGIGSLLWEAVKWVLIILTVLFFGTIAQIIWNVLLVILFIVSAFLPSKHTASDTEPEPVAAKVPSGPSQEYREECERLRELDAQGSTTAAFQLYTLIRKKNPRNFKWREYLKRAALEHCNYEAQYELANCYEKHVIKEHGIRKAYIISLYQRSATQGYRKAKNKLKALGLADLFRKNTD